MSKPATNDIDLDTGFEQVDRRGMPKQVRSYSSRLRASCVPHCAKSSNNLVDAEARQGTVSYRAEDIAGWQCVLRRKQLLKLLHCLFPEWADEPLITFAVQVDLGWRDEIEMLHAQISDLLYPGTGVV